MTSYRSAVLLACALLASAQPSAACPPAWYGVQAMQLREGIPDEQGLIDGKPNENRLLIGEDFVFLVKNTSQDGLSIKLVAQASQADVPVTFVQILPSYYWRVHPLQPLAAGTYTLTYTRTISSRPDVHTYVFQVEGSSMAAPPELQIALDETPYFIESGRRFSCGPAAADCPFETYATTQSKPAARIFSRAVAEPLSDEQQRLFLYRVLPATDPTAEQNTRWEYYSQLNLVSPLPPQELHAPESCWRTQALRISDGEITSGEAQCLSFNADLADNYPGHSKACKSQPTAYAMAFCEDNRASCAPDNPRAATMDMQEACARYADMCGPLLGKRPASVGTCTP